MHSVETKLRVRYAETDAMAVAHHAVYPVWFEVGRTELMHTLGVPYREVESRGFYLMLSALNVQYRRAARYDDLLLLTTRVKEVRSRAVTFDYELCLAEHEGQEHPQVLATGETHHIVTDKTYRPVRFPADLLQLLSP